MSQHSKGSIEADLVDLAGMKLGDLRARGRRPFPVELRRQLHDVDRPRTNMGNSGPPGHAGYDRRVAAPITTTVDEA